MASLRPLALLSAAAFLATAVLPQPSLAQSCPFDADRSPASGVPQELWGTLQPVAGEGELEEARDNTDFERNVPGGMPPGADQPRWVDLSLAGDWIFAGISHGLQIWDASTPDDPVRIVVLSQGDFPSWPADPHEPLPVRTVAAGPDGNHDVMAVGLASQGGLSVFDTGLKSTPEPIYNDTDKSFEDIHAATIGGREYLFAATRLDGLLAYDLTSIQNLGAFCSEETPGETGCGVYEGRIGTRSKFSYLTGVGNPDNTHHWIAVSSGTAAFGMELWDVSDPSAPFIVLSAFDSGSPSPEFVYGLEMWREGSAYYLAVRHWEELKIYDVSYIQGGGFFFTLGNPIWSEALPGQPAFNFLTLSRVGPRPFLHVGNLNRCITTDQNEWLYDVSVPDNPLEITPPSGLVNGQATGYWGWYYPGNPTGFNEVAALTGRFHGPYFYRAAFSIFDIHELTPFLFTSGFESGNTAAWSAVSP